MIWPIVLLLSLSCASKQINPVPQEIERESKGKASIEVPSWEQQWERTQTKGKKEGRLVIFTTFGSDVRDAITRSFTEKTGIKVEVVSGRGGELATKVVSERRAGIYTMDVYIGGANTILSVFKPSGFLLPLDGELILPEIRDPMAWWQKRLPYVDAEQKYVLAFRAKVAGKSIMINTDKVREGELASYFDFLAPRWKGQLIIQDLTTSGKGLRWFSRSLYLKNLDLDYMKALAKQEPVLTRDIRQQVEWVARAKYPVALNQDDAVMNEFVKIGMPLKDIKLKEEKSHLSAGHANIVLMESSLHSNAARFYLNWLLSREGQKIYALAHLSQSARVDVPTGHLGADEIRDLREDYFFDEVEDFLIKEPEYARLAREIFGHLVR